MSSSDRNTFKTTIAVLLPMVAVLSVAAAFADADQHQALSAAIQAVVVVGALIVALQTYRGDRRDRQVDRVLGLNEELTSGDLDAARRRLTIFMSALAEQNGLETRRQILAPRELDNNPSLNHYLSSEGESDPLTDYKQVMRLFERANATRVNGSVDDRLLHELIGRHAAWFAVALAGDGSNPLGIQGPLIELARWANDYARDWKGVRPRYIETWGESRMRDFGRVE